MSTKIWEIFEKIKNTYSLGYTIEDKRYNYTKVKSGDVTVDEFLARMPLDIITSITPEQDILNNPNLNLLYAFVAENQVE
ncbi:hypothetical protein [Spiroplasma clarkii]|uniref:hypothetical protein n=1 Tax=Spiroplasma clarkii TaxID=2139 RepID=UPI0011BA6E37|nr:hypothetical protein [Spiroplasma clarkii]